MRCTNCGSEMADGTRFCMVCGVKMDSAPDQPQPQMQPQPPVQPQPQAMPQMQPQSQVMPQPQDMPQMQPQPQAMPQMQPQPDMSQMQTSPVQPEAPQNGFVPQQESNPQNGFMPQPESNPQNGFVPQQDASVQEDAAGLMEETGPTRVVPPIDSDEYKAFKAEQAAKNANPVQITFVQPDLQNQPAPKKKKKWPIAVAIVAILALLGGGGFFVYEKFFAGNGSVAEEPEPEPDDDDDDDPKPDPGPVQARQTIMLYVIGTDLESENGLASEDLIEISRARLTADTNLIIQTGGCTNWNNTFCKDNKVQRFYFRDGRFTELADLGKLSMASPNTLSDFVSFCAGNYPADDYVLILWDHGGGVPVGYGVDELFPGDMLYDYEIGQALDATGVHFDSIIFDACNMCTLEVGLALRNCADYMIGAESYVNGTGLSYTNWLNCLAESPVSSGKYREMVVSDYMDFCQERGMVASMSVISLDHIDEVYDAYVGYVSVLKKDLENKRYSDIASARDSCGAYMGTDSVDLVTLANKYENNSSTALINSIVNAVDYTESDFAYGHGITAYYPYDYANYYTDGRKSLVELGYDSVITDFYDEYVSLAYAYAYGVSEASRYAGSWYRDDVVSAYENSGYSVAEAGEHHLDSHHTVYDDGMDHYYMETGSIDWISCQSLLFLEDADGTIYYLGQDEFSNFDTDGDLVADNPTSWTWIADQLACYIAYDYYYDDNTGEWNQYGVIPALINGNKCFLMAFYDQDTPSGMITGYYVMDEEREYYYDLRDDDVVQLLWYDYSVEDYVEYGDEFYGRECLLDYNTVDFSHDITYVVYQVTDVYGNVYTSDAYVYVNGELDRLEEY